MASEHRARISDEGHPCAAKRAKFSFGRCVDVFIVEEFLSLGVLKVTLVQWSLASLMSFFS
jgi:hypothetical protein